MYPMATTLPRVYLLNLVLVFSIPGSSTCHEIFSQLFLHAFLIFLSSPLLDVGAGDSAPASAILQTGRDGGTED